MEIQYAPLVRAQNEIRLLQLLPHHGDKKRKRIPDCRIFRACLPNAPRFAALSYVWGDPDRNRVILVEDRPVRVPKNLYDAMVALRLTSEPLVIWIDLLCIDQTNNDEKSWQVGLMGDIYRQAEQVLAWLGPADGESDSVMDHMNSIGAMIQAAEIDRKPQIRRYVWQKLAFEVPESQLERSYVAFRTSDGNIRINSRDDLNTLFYSINGLQGQNPPVSISGIKGLLTRPWWGRIWVMQEIALSKSAVFVCGTKRISRDRFRAAVDSYQAWYFVLKEKFESVDNNSLTPYQLDAVTELFFSKPTIMLSARDIYEHSRFSLSALLRITCVGSDINEPGSNSMESTDPRDKIFALLSLAADRDDLRRRGVFPDYSRSCREVYTSTMMALIQQGHIWLLSFCQTPKIQPNLPSWVPDWSRTMNDMLQEMEKARVPTNPEFDISGGGLQDSMIRVIMRGKDVEEISLIGYVYDEISDAASFPGRASSYHVPAAEMHSWPIRWLVEFLRLTYRNKREYTSFDDRLRAAARSSIGRSIKSVVLDQPAEPAGIEEGIFLNVVTLLKEGIDSIEDNHIKQEVCQFLSGEDAKGNVERYERLRSEITGKSLGRLPFATKRGHLVLAYDYVKKGDVVALFKRSRAPFILRRQNGRAYQLICEAYVDGIMDGEAVENSKFGDLYLV